MNISPSSSSTVPNKGPSSHHEFFAKLYGSFEDKKVTENKMFENKMAENNNDDEDICVDDDDSDSDNSFEQKSEQDNSFEDKSRNDISPRLDVPHRHNLNLTSSQMVEHPTSGKYSRLSRCCAARGSSIKALLCGSSKAMSGYTTIV